MKRGALDVSGLQNIVGFLLAIAQAELRQVFQQHVGGPLQLRTVEFTLLMLLLANDGAAPKQLAATMRLTAPNVTVLLDRMAARELVERRRSHSDGRALEVVLTPAGQALARRAERASASMEAGLLATLSPGERVLLRELLVKLGRGGAREPTAAAA